MRYLILFSLLLFISPYVHGQVNASVKFNRQKTNVDQIIQLSWSNAEVENWRIENQDRLDVMALKTDLVSSSLPAKGIHSTTFSFALQSETNIEILLEIESIAIGESLLFRNKISGEILYSTLTSNHLKTLLPEFNPATTEFVWNTEVPGLYQSKFSFKTFYLHEILNVRGGPTIGFGTALSCHPNAACKQDSIFKLISNSAVRIRMVMDEGIGWCTGSFINNARNDKSPFILTAYHCTFEFTPQYDLWRFDLEYKSDSCANPVAEPTIFSLTGCERKAGGQASDFLLLLLNQEAPSNHQITFAGWDRSDVLTADTSYLIHHPNADIRKISVSVNKAIIHPNQIGWSEGYTTPANHHFRLKFTEGGHQPGSSGGPVYNQDGYLIAQLHGGTLGCEAVNSAFMGRFSKSWNLGLLPEDRLKDWLDPDNTGMTQLPSLVNLIESDLGDIRVTVLDPQGRPVRNVSIAINGSVSDTLITNAEGMVSFNDVNRNGPFQLVPSKNDNQTNGVNVLDLISIQKHLLAKDTFDFPWQFIAADATHNVSVSAGDILVLLRLLLGKITSLPSSPSWRFLPAQMEVGSIPSEGVVNVQFQAIKIGDLNGTSDPRK